MADDPQKPRPGEENLSEEERNRLRAAKLSQEIANKYDPDRLARMVIADAGRGEKLDLATRSEMESRIGGSFSDVRVVKGPFAEAVTRAHKADAVTVAATGMILVREGPRSDPKTALGKALLAHELTHVKQAQKGLQFALEGGAEQGAAHEQEAEAIEAAVHAEETGAASAQGPVMVASNGAADRERIIGRALEMIEEDDRLTRERLGSDDGDG